MMQGRTAEVPSAPSSLARAYLPLALATLFWAGNALLGRALRNDVPPVTLAISRWALAALLIAPFAWRHLRRDLPTLLRAWPAVLVLSLLGISTFNTLLYHAARTTSATNLALIQSTMPAAILALDRLLFAERLTPRRAGGVLLAMVGAAAVVLRGDLGSLWELDLVAGDLWMSLAVVAYALYSVLLRRRPAVHPLSLLAAIFTLGAALLVPLYLWERRTLPPATWSPGALAGVAYVAVFPSILAYLFWNRAVQIIGPAATGVFICLVPLFTAVLAVPLLGERLEPFHVAGFALIGAGLLLSAGGGGAARARSAVHPEPVQDA